MFSLKQNNTQWWALTKSIINFLWKRIKLKLPVRGAGSFSTCFFSWHAGCNTCGPYQQIHACFLHRKHRGAKALCGKTSLSCRGGMGQAGKQKQRALQGEPRKLHYLNTAADKKFATSLAPLGSSFSTEGGGKPKGREHKQDYKIQTQPTHAQRGESSTTSGLLSRGKVP